MAGDHSGNGQCPAGLEILADLVRDNLLQLEDGERLWKLYCFRPIAGRPTEVRHRIYTKVKANGRLALLTFVVHTPVAGRSARSGIARVPDLTVETLEKIVGAIREETRPSPEEYEEIDLTEVHTLTEQIQRLQQQAR